MAGVPDARPWGLRRSAVSERSKHGVPLQAMLKLVLCQVSHYLAQRQASPCFMRAGTIPRRLVKRLEHAHQLRTQASKQFKL
jgi:hypothetical protein